jgi:lipopolysaccharide/colanic/teichoic acid biosynthesis glycosyltransferase
MTDLPISPSAGARDPFEAPMYMSGGTRCAPSGEGVVKQPCIKRSCKRVVDLALGVGCLVAVSPVLLLVALAVKTTSPGPIFFRQTRLGRDMREIVVYKFRTMRLDAEERLRSDPELLSEYLRNGHKLPADREVRLSPIGRLLRQSSIDELPQLINVLQGRMSLVGPRPVLPTEGHTLYGSNLATCLSMRPGMTGLWQVSGRSLVTGTERARLDLEYVRSWSLKGDFGILLRTCRVVVSREGAC